MRGALASNPHPEERSRAVAAPAVAEKPRKAVMGMSYNDSQPANRSERSLPVDLLRMTESRRPTPAKSTNPVELHVITRIPRPGRLPCSLSRARLASAAKNIPARAGLLRLFRSYA